MGRENGESRDPRLGVERDLRLFQWLMSRVRYGGGVADEICIIFIYIHIDLCLCVCSNFNEFQEIIYSNIVDSGSGWGGW